MKRGVNRQLLFMIPLARPSLLLNPNPTRKDLKFVFFKYRLRAVSRFFFIRPAERGRHPLNCWRVVPG